MNPTYTKRRISTAERQLDVVASIAARLGHRWAAITTAAVAMAPTVMRAAGGGIGRTSDVSDPTSSIALGHPHWDELLEAVEAWTEQGRWIEQQVGRYERETPQAIGVEKNTTRCIADPLCNREAVVGNSATNKWAGYCWRCIKNTQRRQTENVQHNADTVQESVIDTASVTPAPPGANTSSSSVWCHLCTLDHPVAAGVDPWQWLEQHRTICDG